MHYITLEQLKEKGAIYVEDISLSANEPPFHIIEGGKEEYHVFFQRLIEQNGLDTSYGDFHFKRVEETGKDILFMNSTVGEVRVMQELFYDAHENNEDREFVLVRLEERVLKTLLSISFGELLFSSFYFIDLGCTIWSNYNGRFLVFVKNTETAKEVERIAEECGIAFEW